MSVFITSRCLVAFILVSLLSTLSSARGGGGFGRSEDRDNPDHIESLPPEIRDAVIHQCITPRALHPFAHYTDNLQTVVLHYEHFYCSAGGTFCGEFELRRHAGYFRPRKH
jgi:hypothetical protein